MYDTSASKADNIDIRKYFKERMSDEYSKYKKKNKDRHFSTPEQMNEFFQDGVAILEWFKKHKRGRKAFFSPRQSELVGIEIPLILQPIKERPNIKYMGYVDLVTKDKNTGEYTIYDINGNSLINGWIANQEAIDLTWLENGKYYIMQLNNNGIIENHRFLKH